MELELSKLVRFLERIDCLDRIGFNGYYFISYMFHKMSITANQKALVPWVMFIKVRIVAWHRISSHSVWQGIPTLRHLNSKRVGPVGAHSLGNVFPMTQIICISNFRSLLLIGNILWLFGKYTLVNVTTFVTTLHLSF